MADKHEWNAPGLPPYSRYGEKVPKGGTSCKNCEYLAENKKDCTNRDFIAWNGNERIPGEIDSYCSIWWEGKD